MPIEAVAAQASQNSVGLVASWIGQVQSAEPSDQVAMSPKRLEQWQNQKKQLLFRLKQALLIEVDYGKSAERFEQVTEIGGETLAADVGEWIEQHPVPFFKAYKKDKLYDRFSLPTQGTAAINVLPQMVNHQWQATKPYRHPRKYFQSVLVDPKLMASAQWEGLKEKAKDFKDQFMADCAVMRELGLSGDATRKAYSQLYQAYQEQLARSYPSQVARRRFQQALWYCCHSDTQAKAPDIKAWADRCRTKGYEICFGHRQGNQALDLPSQALPFVGYVLNAPMGADDSRDKVLQTKAWLDQKGIRYTALMRRDVPYVEFALHNPSSSTLHYLDDKFGLNELPSLQKVKQDCKVLGQSRVAFPKTYLDWAESPQEEGVAALAYAVLVDELCLRLEQLRPKQLQVTGIQYNDYAQQSFRAEHWRHPVTLEVGRLQLDPADARYARLHNKPCIKLEGKILGVFGDGSPQFPNGTTMRALIPPRQRPSESVMMVRINPKSIHVPAVEGGDRPMLQVDVKSQEVGIREMRVLQGQGETVRSSSTTRQTRHPDWQL